MNVLLDFALAVLVLVVCSSSFPSTIDLKPTISLIGPAQDFRGKRFDSGASLIGSCLSLRGGTNTGTANKANSTDTKTYSDKAKHGDKHSEGHDKQSKGKYSKGKK